MTQTRIDYIEKQIAEYDNTEGISFTAEEAKQLLKAYKTVERLKLQVGNWNLILSIEE